MQLGLNEKVALVSAGSKGMGRAIALAFASEGMKVAISARGKPALDATVAEVAAQGHGALAIETDVSRASDVQNMVSKTVSHFGRLDVLIVNAGGPPAKPFVEASEGDWEAAFNLTLMSAVRMIREALPHLVASRGNVITIESFSVKQPVNGLLLSNALRPGVVGMVKTLTDELGDKGVRFNNILPGMIMTDRSKHLAETRAKATGQSVDDVISQTSSSIPLRRYGEPEEIANLAVFLASSAASYITGTSILCDGGLYRGLY